jgi:DNA-binding NarL/FixJ family response regulator
MAELRVFLADDHAVVREGLKALVNAQVGMAVCGEAGDGLTACQQVERLLPDVVVMDVSMPELNGARAAERLKQACPQVKVLALTVHEDKGYLRRLLEAGAAGYVLKRAAAEELVHAIRTVAAGGVYLDPAVAGKVVGGFVRPAPSSGPARGGELSEREEEVVRLTAAGHSNKEIAARLELSVKTVETYKARSLEKLGLRTRADLVRYALQRGWLEGGRRPRSATRVRWLPDARLAFSRRPFAATPDGGPAAARPS